MTRAIAAFNAFTPPSPAMSETVKNTEAPPPRRRATSVPAMKKSTRRLLYLFAIPAALFAAEFAVRIWRFPNASLLSHVEDFWFFFPIGALIAAAVGVLWLLLAQLAALIARRRNERKAACFLLPTLVVLSLYAFFFLWLEAGAVMETSTLARMDREWADANPQTADDVRRIFGEPDQTEPFRARNSETRWLYHPLPFVCAPLATPYQVWLDADGNIVGHGHRGD